YNPQKKQKKTSKCFVYIFTTFVFLCLFLFIFACIILPIKNPTIKINSISIKSLEYNYSPSFNLTTLIKISIKNSNFGYLDFNHKNNNTINLIYGNGNVLGTSELKVQDIRVGFRDKKEVNVEMKGTLNLKKDYNEIMKLNSELSSGNLELIGFVSLNGNVHLLKNVIMPSVVAQINCTFGIDLRTKLVQKKIC
ncbi:hypothetical protein RND81_08G110900, partial [Saponaria officinalis]